MPSHHKKNVGIRGCILLVEEYRPLATAFGSAVKKFAGNYETHVVLSLAEAEKSFSSSRPELIVLDFDPPQRGSVDFFQRLKASMPDTRVLILVAEKVPDLSAVQSSPRAFHFIEKPFELAEFGAAIARLLKSKGPGGRMRDFDLVDLVTLYALSKASLILRVEGGSERGEIHFAEGRILHTSAMDASGISAFQMIIGWQSARFIEAARHSDSRRSMQTSWLQLLTDALLLAPSKAAAPRKVEHQNLPPPSPPAPAPSAPPPPPAPPTPSPTPKAGPAPTKVGKKIVIVDDTELLSLFVGESLTASDPTLEITTSLTGLDGLDRVAKIMPDLVLLDYSLPDIKGDEVASRLLENPKTAAIPIIMMSGHVREMAETAERFVNVVAAIPKPFLSSALVDLVTRTLAEPPKQSEPPPEKATQKIPALEPTEPHVIATKKATNGRRAASKPAPTEKSPHEIAKPEPEQIPKAIESPIATGTEVNQRAMPATPFTRTPAAEEEDIAFDPLSLAPPPETEFADINPTENAGIGESQNIPAAIKAAKSNAVVLGFPLEVISLEFSAELRIERLRARTFSSAVSIRVLPQSVPGISTNEMIFQLAEVTLDARAQIDLVRLAPASAPLPKFSSYPCAIDGVEIASTKDRQAFELIPTAVAPMRLQLLSLFELCSVELSTEFRVAHLVLKSRGEKTRVTLLPEVSRTGATFEIAAVRIDRLAAIDEIVLQAPA